MRRENIDTFERIKDWFVRAFDQKAVSGNAKILIFDGHPNNPTRFSELFSLGGRETDFEASPNEAWEIFFEEWNQYLTDFPKKFLISIGNPEGGSPKRMKVNVSLNPNYSIGGASGFGNSWNESMNLATLQFNMFKSDFEKRQLEEKINQILESKQSETRIGKLLDNLVETIGQPEIVNTLVGAILTKVMNPGSAAPVNISSAGFVNPESQIKNQEENIFRSRFADYGEVIKKSLFDNEKIVFQVMENLVLIIQDQEKVNKLLAYVNELNSVDQIKE